MPPEERAQADRRLRRWGALTIIVSRAVPLLAETVAVLAGASPMSWGQAAAAAFAGSLPAALLYALTGAIAARFQHGAVMFGLIVLVALTFWFIGRWLEPRLINKENQS
ncbi:MAG: VTT domain-containing protein [Chloroflexota bacterium]|nr:VTT domain-containing protein [Chloroflexota bacterium]